MTDFERVFEDGGKGVMDYALRNLGGFDKGSRDDLRRFLERSDPHGRLSRIMDEVLDTDAASKYIIKEPSVVRAAIRTELHRPLSARRRDESRTAQIVEGINLAHYRSWKKNPGAFDLRGIDTKTHSYIRREIAARTAKARSVGYDVRHVGGDYVRIMKNKSWRSVITGRFVKRP